MRAWRLFNALLLLVLLYLGAAKLASWPPFEEATRKTSLTPEATDPDQGAEVPGKDGSGANTTDGPPAPRAVQVSTRDVAQALTKATLWLIQHQGKNGSWGEMTVKGAYGPFHSDRPGFHQAGPSALVLYALVKSGVPLRHPAVRKGFAYLEKHHKWPATSPETSMVLMAVTATAHAAPVAGADTSKGEGRLGARYRGWAQDLVSHLLKKRSATGWRYNYEGRREPPQIGGPEDIISTHLAAMALFSARSIGVKTRDEVWLDILRYTLGQQEPSSRPDDAGREHRGFAYVLGHNITDEGKATGGTTACGIANILMARYALSDRGTRPQALREIDATLDDKARQGVSAAMAWLEANWHPSETPGKTRGSKVLHHHWLWALETAMDLNPLQPGRLGRYSWYSEIADALIGRQHDDGSWHSIGTWEPAGVLDTSLAILVLERASRGLIR